MTRDDMACPCCQRHDLALKYKLSNPDYHTARCRACGFVFMHPYPSDSFLHQHYKSRSLYNSDHDLASYDRAVADRAALISAMLQKAGIMARDGRSIDFGAGAGIAVAAQKSLGFDAMGIETNPEAQAIGRRIFGVDIQDVELDKMPKNLSLFTLFEVLEHIKYPRDFLAQVRRHMKAGGAIVGSVPNYNGLARYLRGNRSDALVWPEHVNQFTKKNLFDTLTGAGFDVVYIGFPPPLRHGYISEPARLAKKTPAGRRFQPQGGVIRYLDKEIPRVSAAKYLR